MEHLASHHRKLIGLLGTVVALTVAYIYYFVVPADTSEVVVLQAILTYGHSLCWIFLAIASVLWGMNKAHKWVTYLAYAAGASYVIFLISFIVNRLL